MKVIGITGGVGAGKSSVLKYIEENVRCEIIYADSLAATLQKKGQVCYDKLISLLGEEIIGTDGEINRPKMAEIIFGDDKLLEAVNNIVHPAVEQFIRDRIEYLRNNDIVDFLFIEAALLIECGYKEIVDEMWYIYASEDVRRKRLKQSRNYSDDKIDSIMESQLSEEKFRAGSDVVIDNSKDMEDTILQIEDNLYER